MGRNCNLELRLVTPSFDDHTTLENIHQSQIMKEEVKSKNQQMKQGNQKLTIFYNGQVSSCDVTEIQARSIISLACQEIVRAKPRTPPCSAETCSESSPKPQQQYKLNRGPSMKKSLRQFLQKRRTRIQATSPYSTH